MAKYRVSRLNRQEYRDCIEKAVLNPIQKDMEREENLWTNQDVTSSANRGQKKETQYPICRTPPSILAIGNGSLFQWLVAMK
jgi:hypothetical protein